MTRMNKYKELAKDIVGARDICFPLWYIPVSFHEELYEKMPTETHVTLGMPFRFLSFFVLILVFVDFFIWWVWMIFFFNFGIWALVMLQNFIRCCCCCRHILLLFSVVPCLHLYILVLCYWSVVLFVEIIKLLVTNLGIN